MDIQRQSSSRPSELAERHSLSRGFIYKQISLGLLRARKAGKATIVTAEDEQAWLKSMPLIEADTEPTAG
jgi:hypothetical protein